MKYLARRLSATEVAVDDALYTALVDCYTRLTKTVVLIDNRLLCALCGDPRHTEGCPIKVIEDIKSERTPPTGISGENE